MPFCDYCGHEVGEQAVACASCGHPLGAPTTVAPAPGSSADPTAIAALVTGIIGIFACPWVLSVAAIVLGSVALSKLRAAPGSGGPALAVAGIVLGAIGLVVGIAGGILWRGWGPG